MAQEKKKSPLYVGKRTYGEVPIEEAFKKALEPYFKEDIQSKKIS